MKLEHLYNKEHFIVHCKMILHFLKCAEWYKLEGERIKVGKKFEICNEKNIIKHPSIKHYLREAVREASNQVTPLPQSKDKSKLIFISENAMFLDKVDEKIIAEHIVPISVIQEMILSLKNPSEVDIQNILLMYSLKAAITNNDDEILSDKLRKTMPNEWSSPFARYNEAQISIYFKKECMVEIEDYNPEIKKWLEDEYGKFGIDYFKK